MRRVVIEAPTRGTSDRASKYGGLSVKTLYIVVIVAFISCLVGDPAAAQETTGTISGRIVDAQGLVLPGVVVAATGAQGVKTTATDADGGFTLPFLTPGTYVIHVE